MNASMEFVLEICDVETECIIKDVPFEHADTSGLFALLDITDFNPNCSYELGRDEVVRLKEYLALDFEGDDYFVRLKSRHALDDLPYKTHTNRELLLMLTGTKPLAVFCGEYPPNIHFEEIPNRLFDPFVAAGRFVKREYVVPTRDDRTLGIRWVLYSLPSEIWRIDAFILLKQTADRVGWNDGFERMEGSLLGYAEWQNDAFMEWREKRNK